MAVPNIELSEYGIFVQSKVLAIEAVYRKWGPILVEAIRALYPSDTGKLRASIMYRIDSPKNPKDINSLIKLFVGVDRRTFWKYKNLIRFFEYGTIKHFIPMKAKSGYYTGILGYMQRHNLVYRGMKTIGNKRAKNSEEVWRWKNNQRVFYGVMGKTSARWIFSTVYKRYESTIKNEVNSILNKR
jgi:hypothetical protein